VKTNQQGIAGTQSGGKMVFGTQTGTTMVTAINGDAAGKEVIKEMTRRKAAGTSGGKIVTRRKAGVMERSRQNTNNSRAQEIQIESGRAKAGQRRVRNCCHLASVSPDCSGLKSRWRWMIRPKRPSRST
tara:strand:- start:2 stop:388 length:387 start_codon:yes stop_codon:yes gene_type:complete